jgi:hypothetical protein
VGRKVREKGGGAYVSQSLRVGVVEATIRQIEDLDVTIRVGGQPQELVEHGKF